MEPGVSVREEFDARGCHVFLSHRGPDCKRDYADFIYRYLKLVEERYHTTLNVFLDEVSLARGAGLTAVQAMKTACNHTRIGVVVITKGFLTTQWPMEELGILLERRKTPGERPIKIIPIFRGVSPGDCASLAEKYRKWSVEGEWSMEDVDAATLQQWVQWGQQLAEETGYRTDQFTGMEGATAQAAADRITKILIDEGILPSTVTAEKPKLDHSKKQLDTLRREVVGRERQIQDVVGGLRKHGAAVLYGGPGEGKSTVATAAGNRVWEAGECPAGAFLVNFNGFKCDEKSEDGAAAAAAAAQSVKSFLVDALTCKLHLQQQGQTARPQQVTAADKWQQLLSELTSPGQQRFLVVLENSEEVLHLGPAYCQGLVEAIEDLQATGNVWMIVNSRMQLGQGLGQAPQIPLKALNCEDAVALLKLYSGSNAKWTESVAKELADIVCGGNACLISTIAGFIASGRCMPQEAIEAYNKVGASYDDIGSSSRYTSTLGLIQVKHDIQKEWLQRFLFPDELRVMKMLSLFMGSFSSEDVVAMVPGITPDVKPVRIRAFLADFQRISILQAVGSDQTESRYRMHPLLRESALSLLKQDEEDCRQACEMYFHWLVMNPTGPGGMLVSHNPCKVDPGVKPDLWVCLQTLSNHRADLRQLAFIFPKVVCSADMLGKTCLQIALIGQSLLCVDEVHLADEFNSTVTSLVHKYGDGELSYISARALKMASLRSTDVEGKEALYQELVGLINARKEADRQADGPLSQFITEPPSMDMMLFKVQGDMAPAYVCAGQFDKAEQLWQNGLELMKECSNWVLATDIVIQEINLARTWLLMGKLPEAKTSLQAIIAKLRTIPNSEPWALQAKSTLSEVMAKEEDFQGAIRLMEEVLEGYVRTLGRGSATVAAAKVNLAEWYAWRRNGKMCFTLFKEVEAVYEEEYGRLHITTLGVKKKHVAFALLCGQQEEVDKVLAQMRECIAEYGPDSPEAAVAEETTTFVEKIRAQNRL